MTLSMLLFFQILAVKPFSFPLIHALFIHCTLCAERVHGTFAAPVFLVLFFYCILFSLGVFLVLACVENASLECCRQFSHVTIK